MKKSEFTKDQQANIDRAQFRGEQVKINNRVEYLAARLVNLEAEAEADAARGIQNQSRAREIEWTAAVMMRLIEKTR
jgi:hypothetical protein